MSGRRTLAERSFAQAGAMQRLRRVSKVMGKTGAVCYRHKTRVGERPLAGRFQRVVDFRIDLRMA